MYDFKMKDPDASVQINLAVIQTSGSLTLASALLFIWHFFKKFIHQDIE